MKTYADRIAEKKAKHAEELAQLEQEALISTALPPGADSPRSIMLGSAFRKCPWICYEVATLRDACALIAKMPEPQDVSAREDGCLSVEPIELMSDSYKNGKERWTEATLIEVRQNGGKGFYSCELSFWVRDFAGLAWARIKIEVKQLPYELRASVSATYSQHGDVCKATFREAELMRDHATQRVKFGGGSADAFDVRYYFSGLDHLGEFVNAHTAKAA